VIHYDEDVRRRTQWTRTTARRHRAGVWRDCDGAEWGEAWGV